MISISIMQAFQVTIFAVLIASAAGTVDVHSECYSGCNFRTCYGQNTFDMRFTHANVAFTGNLCMKNTTIRVGELVQSGEAYIIDWIPEDPKIAFVPISQWKEDGLRRPYRWDIFRVTPKYIPFGDGDDGEQKWRRSGYSGVARSPFSDVSQRKRMNRKCIVLPVRGFMRFNEQEDRYRYVRTLKGRDCVAFRVFTPED